MAARSLPTFWTFTKEYHCSRKGNKRYRPPGPTNSRCEKQKAIVACSGGSNISLSLPTMTYRLNDP